MDNITDNMKFLVIEYTTWRNFITEKFRVSYLIEAIYFSLVSFLKIVQCPSLSTKGNDSVIMSDAYSPSKMNT